MNWERYQIHVQEPSGILALASAGPKVSENILLEAM